MLHQIQGLHHVTSMASDARANNAFFTGVLGLRRVKTTVNFDAPDVYHLYYGDEIGTPGSVMTYFPFPNIGRARRGAGEVGTTVFAVPEGSLAFWRDRLAAAGVGGIAEERRFGARRLCFDGPDADRFALVEVAGDTRPGWTGGGVPAGAAVHGFHSVSLRLQDAAATEQLLGFMGFMGYERAGRDGAVTRMAVKDGRAAGTIDIETLPGAGIAQLGAGSVHHVAFAVEDRAAQLAVRQALGDTGYQVTPVIDRDYFWAIYFRTPGGVLFEIATDEPGFTRDETRAALGTSLKLPARYEHARAEIEAHLQPLAA